MNSCACVSEALENVSVLKAVVVKQLGTSIPCNADGCPLEFRLDPSHMERCKHLLPRAVLFKYLCLGSTCNYPGMGLLLLGQKDRKYPTVLVGAWMVLDLKILFKKKIIINKFKSFVENKQLMSSV